MPSESGRGSKENAKVLPNKSALINEENLQELPVERKDQYLKRIAKERKVGAAANKKDSKTECIHVVGTKVLRKIRNKAGSVYSFYEFNGRKHPAAFNTMLEKGYLLRGDPKLPSKQVRVPVRIVNGEAYKKKG